MARIIPSDLTRLALSGAHEPEITTLAHLKDALPEDYTVFHGVHWSRQYRGATLYGEIDFVVLNRSGQVLCIEQKNGPLSEREDGLYKDYGEQRKNVADQIRRTNRSDRQRALCGGANVSRYRGRSNGSKNLNFVPTVHASSRHVEREYLVKGPLAISACLRVDT